MARLLGPDPTSRLIYLVGGYGPYEFSGRLTTIYSDAGGTVPADVAAYDGTSTPGASIANSQLRLDATSRLPQFWFPADGTDTLWARPLGGPLVEIRADMDARQDRDESQPLGVNVKKHGAATSANAATNTTAFVNAIAEANTLKVPLFIPGGTWQLNTDALTLPTRIAVHGAGRDITILSFAGTGAAFGNPTPGTRIFDWNLADLSLSTSTAAVAFDCDSLSTSVFRNIKASGFSDVGWSLHSSDPAGSVYNRWYNCTAQSVPTGYRLRANSANANIWHGCRANVCTVRGWDIQDSNDNVIEASQAEQCGVGVYLDGTVSGGNGWNRIRDVRVEVCTTGVQIASANVTDTVIDGLWSDSSTATPINDAGTRTRRAGLYLSARTANSIVALDSGWQFVSGASITLGTTSSSIQSATSAPLYLRGNAADNSSAVGTWIGNGTTLTNAAARIVGFSRDTPVTHGQPAAYVDQDGSYEFASGVKVMSGTGTPEGAVTAPVGTLFLRSNGGSGTTFYVKESGTGNTGWVAK